VVSGVSYYRTDCSDGHRRQSGWQHV